MEDFWPEVDGILTENFCQDIVWERFKQDYGLHKGLAVYRGFLFDGIDPAENFMWQDVVMALNWTRNAGILAMHLVPREKNFPFRR